MLEASRKLERLSGGDSRARLAARMGPVFQLNRQVIRTGSVAQPWQNLSAASFENYALVVSSEEIALFRFKLRSVPEGTRFPSFLPSSLSPLVTTFNSTSPR